MADFSSAKNWVTQAREDLADLRQRELAVFGNEQAYSIFEDMERNPGLKVTGIKIAKPPETLSTKAANIVTNLRSALDQATWRASVALGANEREKIYFPLAGAKTNFDNLFLEKGASKNIPAELHPFLKGLQGYPTSKDYQGGNNLLYALSPISNPNKHTETYRVGLAVSTVQWGRDISADGVLDISLPLQINFTTNEIILGTTTPTGYVRMNVTLPAYISFGEVPIVARQPVIPVLNKTADMIEGIVLGIEAETTRLVAAKT